jgi:glycine/D-amino acid oxidase-like deaminating enzyme
MPSTRELLGTPPWTAPHPPASVPLPRSCEVLVVGAGVTGLSAALALASEGRDVLIVDRRFGSGAACRSGGIIVGDTLIGPAPGFEGCDLELRDWVVAHAPACRLEWAGCIELDRDDRLRAEPIDWQDAGLVRLSRIVEGGTLDPAALVSALAWQAVERGARFVNAIAIDRCERSESSLVASGDGRTVHADAVLFATDATDAGTRRLWPQRQLTVAMETTVIPDDLADEIGWRDRRPFYTNELPLLWGRVLDDGAMLAGRELVPVDDSASFEPAFQQASARLIARIRGLHPALARIEPRRFWAGPIARDQSGVPSVRPDPDVRGAWWAGGYGGHGLAQAFRLGALAATAIRSDSRRD